MSSHPPEKSAGAPDRPIGTLTVALFAGMAALAGVRSLTLAWSNGTVGDLRQALGAAQPHLIPLLQRSAVAVAGAYAGDAERVPAGSDVAIIPPVSGG